MLKKNIYSAKSGEGIQIKNFLGCLLLTPIKQLHFSFKLKISSYISGGNLNWQIYLEDKLAICIKSSINVYGLWPNIWHLGNDKLGKTKVQNQLCHQFTIVLYILY